MNEPSSSSFHSQFALTSGYLKFANLYLQTLVLVMVCVCLTHLTQLTTRAGRQRAEFETGRAGKAAAHHPQSVHFPRRHCRGRSDDNRGESKSAGFVPLCVYIIVYYTKCGVVL